MKVVLVILAVLVINFSGIYLVNRIMGKKPNNENKVYQTIKRTCNESDCYYALYTTVYFKGAKVKEWIDNAEYLTPKEVKGRKIEGDSLIKLFDKFELKYENLLNESK